MFDIGMFEMILIGVIALLILGPERMPEAARAAGRWIGKARSFITGIKADVASQMSVAELNELRQLRNDLASAQTELNKIQQNTSQALNQKVPQQASTSQTLPAEDPSGDAGAEKKQKSEQA